MNRNTKTDCARRPAAACIHAHAGEVKRAVHHTCALALAWATVLLALCGPGLVFADETIRIGIVGPFSGPFASIGAMFRQGIETYVALNGTSAGGRAIKLIYRDTGGANPATAKQLAEQLIVQDKVVLLAGFYLSPEAAAASPVFNETKTPALLLFAGGKNVTQLSNFVIRTGSSNEANADVMVNYALKQGWKKFYIAVADYSPGLEMVAVFERRIKAAGGTVVGSDRIPLNTVDYSPFAERVANAKPDAVLGFVPNGAPAVAWHKALSAQGVDAKRVPIIGVTETDDSELAKFDDTVAGSYSVIFYSPGADNDANRVFKSKLRALYPQAIPAMGDETAYNAMHILYSMVASQQGKPFDTTSALAAVQGMSWDAPRGRVRIVPGARELETPMFVRRVQKVDGKLQNVIVDVERVVPQPVSATNTTNAASLK